MKIALDAGHGASRGCPSTGASANGLVEDELALDLVKRIGHHLRAAGHTTVYTRPTTQLVTLAARARIARAAACELLISVHCNAGPPAANGVEAFVVEGDLRSRHIALESVRGVVPLGLADRGVKWDSRSAHRRLAVLRGTYRHMPAVLLEVGFLTGSPDAAMLARREFREAVAVAVARAVLIAQD